MLGLKYVSIYPKIMAWKNSILKEEELENALEMNVQELIDLAKSKFKKVNFEGGDLLSLERVIRQEGYAFLESVEKFLYGSSKKFFKSWLKIYEIENIKLIFKSILFKNKLFLNMLFDLGKGNKFQLEFVRDIDSLDGFLDFLSGTEYYRIAKNTLPRVNETNEPLFFDVALDNYFVEMLNRFYTGLSFIEKIKVRALLLYFFESKRISAIYRAKFFFGINKNECMVLVPRILDIFSPLRYEMLLEAKTEEEFIKLLLEWRYITIEDFSAKELLEYYFLKELLRRARKGMRSGPFDLSFTLSFFILHYINVKNWSVLIQSKKEGIEKEDAMRFLFY